MATAYLAEDLRHRRKVAVKVLPEIVLLTGQHALVADFGIAYRHSAPQT